jgi:hypothetical protein
MNKRLKDLDEAIKEHEIPEDELKLRMNAETALRQVFTRDEPTKMPSRAQSDSIWRAIAAGVLSDASTARWASWVGKDIVANVIDSDCSAQEKPRQALRAIKLSGKAAPRGDEELRTAAIFLKLSNGLSKLKAGPSMFGWIDPPAKVSTYERAKSLHARGRFKQFTLKALQARIDRLTK